MEPKQSMIHRIKAMSFSQINNVIIWIIGGIVFALVINAFSFQWLWFPQTIVITVPLLIVIGQIMGWIVHGELFASPLDKTHRFHQAYPIVVSMISDVSSVLLLLVQIHALDGSERDFIFILVMALLFKSVFIIMILAMRFKRALIVDCFLSLLSFGLSFILYTLAVTV